MRKLDSHIYLNIMQILMQHPENWLNKLRMNVYFHPVPLKHRRSINCFFGGAEARWQRSALDVDLLSPVGPNSLWNRRFYHCHGWERTVKQTRTCCWSKD